MSTTLTGSVLLSLLKDLNDTPLDEEKIKKAICSILPSLTDEILCDHTVCSLFKDVEFDVVRDLPSGLGQLTAEQRACIGIALLNNNVGAGDLEKIAGEVWCESIPVPALLAAAKKAHADGMHAVALSFLKVTTPSLKNILAVGQAEQLRKDILARCGEDNFNTQTKVALLANCTCQPIAAIMPLALMAHGINAEVWESPYDSWASQMLDKASELYQFSPSYVVIYLSSLGMTRAASSETEDHLAILKSGLNNLLANSAANIILILPDALEEELHGTSRFCAWRRSIRDEMLKFAGPRVFILEPEQILARLGSDKVFAPRLWYHAKLPMHPSGLYELGKETALTVARIVSQPVKVVACDLDNTLWGGVVGEDGVDNLKLDVHDSGGAFIRLQAFLKELLGKGIILIAVSKNNLSDVLEVFEKRTEMLLKADDFTLILADWKPKSQNLVSAANKLNLGLKNFCFLDDSAFERSEVRTALPDVIVPELPANPDEYVGFLVRTGLFHIPRVTAEDKVRGRMYKNEVDRANALSSSANLEDFLSNLKLEVNALRIDSSNINRVNQLIHKTNQFNLTTRRHDAEKVDIFAKNDSVFSYCYRVSDKFGDSGITGILIATPTTDPITYEIDSWILSCRVMGRTVENALFHHLISWLQNRNIKRLVACYIPTAKNRPVVNLLPSFGFSLIEESEDGTVWYEYDISSGLNDNCTVKLITN